MYDYLTNLYYGEPLHNSKPTALDSPNSKLSQHLTMVQQEMGDTFADKLTKTITAELNRAQVAAFHDGIQLGSQLTLCFLGIDS